MTLIGAFRSNGVPTLIGDFLTSVRGGRSTEGYKKTTWRVTPQLAVAWTGWDIDADVLAQHLKTYYSSGSAIQGKVGVEEALAACEPLRPGLHIIGWTVEDGVPACFKWDTSLPEHTSWEEGMFLGTGGEYVDKLVGQEQQLRGHFQRGGEAELSPAEYALSAGAQLMATDGYNRTEKAFGFGYDVLLWSDAAQRFEYVDNVLSTTLVGHFDESGAYKGFQQIEPSYYYRTLQNEFSEVCEMQHRSKQGGRHLIAPPGASGKEARRLDIQRQAQDRLTPVARWIQPKYFTCLYHSVGPKFVSGPISMVYPSDSDGAKEMFQLQARAHWLVTPPDKIFHVLGDAWLAIHGGADAEFAPGVRDPRVWRGIP